MVFGNSRMPMLTFQDFLQVFHLPLFLWIPWVFFLGVCKFNGRTWQLFFCSIKKSVIATTVFCVFEMLVPLEENLATPMKPSHSKHVTTTVTGIGGYSEHSSAPFHLLGAIGQWVPKRQSTLKCAPEIAPSHCTVKYPNAVREALLGSRHQQSNNNSEFCALGVIPRALWERYKLRLGISIDTLIFHHSRTGCGWSDCWK